MTKIQTKPPTGTATKLSGNKRSSDESDQPALFAQDQFNGLWHSLAHAKFTKAWAENQRQLNEEELAEIGLHFQHNDTSSLVLEIANKVKKSKGTTTMENMNFTDIRALILEWYKNWSEAVPNAQYGVPEKHKRTKLNSNSPNLEPAHVYTNPVLAVNTRSNAATATAADAANAAVVSPPPGGAGGAQGTITTFEDLVDNIKKAQDVCLETPSEANGELAYAAINVAQLAIDAEVPKSSFHQIQLNRLCDVYNNDCEAAIKKANEPHAVFGLGTASPTWHGILPGIAEFPAAEMAKIIAHFKAPLVQMGIEAIDETIFKNWHDGQNEEGAQAGGGDE